MCSRLLVYFFFFALECWLVTSFQVDEKDPEVVYMESEGSQLNKQMLTDEHRDTRAATVYRSNMPTAMQTRVLSYVNEAYSSSSGKLGTCQTIQRNMQSYQPRYRWNVVINYDVISYYSNYYAIVWRNTDEVLIYGVSSSNSVSQCTIVLLLISFLAYVIN
ncbi:uncharacterized protein LOC108742088 [Agrilus planipennis]|uniref:Uncharacterized protein LOC108742088 n=1 Tax=Agrilus planipennis TaxID=224129 RepID=A0A1W4XJI0_AGRPL|nr:uncharacterized protein LOC108742088 [Agrilus planipennis]